MGSLRTPVGPLPSSIYWRRRGVLLLLVALVALLVIWALRPGGGGEDSASPPDDGEGGPAESITPGPTPSESLIDERPGGRDDPPGDDATGEDGGSGEDGGGDTEGGEGAADGSSDGGENGGENGAGGQGGLDPAGVPVCATSAVTLSLRTDANEYAAGEEPEIRLTAQNASNAACRLDFGHEELTVTVADESDSEVWTSDACPEGGGSDPVVVEADGTVTHALTWERRHSDADCGGAPGQAAAAGTYVAKARLTGHPVMQISFVLDDD
ncbi:hypothetical protein [Streptomyces sp. SBT349]|uniref:hypothetical protein n=1 Tax=Streptomyces sp. SBT349 TaxID=1580539 RepID=UPI00066A717E|nr:hypothetical protein [Streptomyces sp. SBT349]